MEPNQIYYIFFNNLVLFLTLTFFSCLLLFYSVKNFSIGGYLDPIHVIWTFTFGTAYALVAGLYILEKISFYYFGLVALYGVLLILFIWIFKKINIEGAVRLLRSMCLESKNKKSILFIIVCFYFLLIVSQFFLIGVGSFSSSNRFEQARGFGFLIRLIDSVIYFIIAYYAIYIFKCKKIKLKISLVLFLILFIAINSVLNGAKISFVIYCMAAVCGVSIYENKKPKFNGILFLIFIVISTSLALYIQSFDIKNLDLDASKDSSYFSPNFYALERLAFRVIGNGDQYYMGLPDGVIESIKTDNLFVQFVSPIFGSTFISNIVGYNTNDLTVGRQLTLYISPEWDMAGGAVSHFDLFAYKYFGLAFSWVWVMITAFILSSVYKLKKISYKNEFASSFSVQLWISSLYLLMEPAIGMAKIFDVIFIFTLFGLFAKFIFFNRGKYRPLQQGNPPATPAR